MSTQPLARLHVTGVRYRGSRPAQGDERALDAYTRSKVYEQAQAPLAYREALFPEHLRSAAEPDNLGALGGAIAESVAAARRAGQAVLLTGGDCTHSTGVLGGLHYALGYAGHGVAMATYLGTQIAEQLAGASAANPFAAIRFPGAPLGLYDGRPWFLPFAGAWYKFLDWVR